MTVKITNHAEKTITPSLIVNNKIAGRSGFKLHLPAVPDQE